MFNLFIRGHLHRYGKLSACKRDGCGFDPDLRDFFFTFPHRIRTKHSNTQYAIIFNNK